MIRSTPERNVWQELKDLVAGDPELRRPRPRYQRGQAIVLIALMLTLVVGVAALAIDGARAYSLRRDLQNAVDSAALAAADRLQQTRSYTQAEQAATAIFAINMRQYGVPSCAPGYGAPGVSPRSLTCTFTDGTVLTQVVSTLGAAGSQFALTASQRFQLLFANILTNGVTPVLSATATGGVDNNLYSPALAALSQSGCGGQPGSALSVSGSGTLVVHGDVVSNGAISVSTGTVQVAGDVYARCQANVGASVTSACYPSRASAPCTFPDVAGTTRSGYRFVDPNYPPPRVSGGSRGSPGIEVVLSPGSYATDPVFNNNVCWFLSGGVYQWARGLTNDGDFMSNELKPPDEPLDTNNTILARRQFWNSNGVRCAGSFNVTAVGGNAIPSGTWAIVVTSTRADTYAGVTYARESAPSLCRTVSVGAGQAIQVQISNVPGASGYDVYAAPPPTGCSGPFGYAASIAVTGPVQNSITLGCPSFAGGCTLGNESAVVDGTVLNLFWAPNPLVAPGVVGAHPPDGETAPLGFRQVNQNPDRALPPHGDRANENQCDTVGGALTTCPGAITPGAVSIYIPAGGCLTDTNNGDNFIFSGYQFNWIAIHEPGASNPPANTCANLLDAASNSAYVGLVYAPSAAINIPTRVGIRTEATGGFIADTISFSGPLPLIVFSRDYAPVPPAARLLS
ncbi:MAG TPA: pilus assembly protein TadG-related protein [Candidatus Dormibacteraeota bacterium]|nr:pilus assembly protein TadG-related protein [Candidatus Dormibacteraeota bacterium]